MAITKKFWTRAQIIAKVERDLDLEDEDFIQAEEMYGYVEEAIDETEKVVNALHEDYFLSRDSLVINPGQDEYALPDAIFASKIRRITYKAGSRFYVMKRIRDWKKFETYLAARDGTGNGGMELQYFLYNAVPGEQKILLTGLPTEAAEADVWFIRQANRLETDTDMLDIPEATSFVIQYVKVRCYEKEGNPNLLKAIGDLSALKENLEGTLRDMVPDDESEIEMDVSFYQGMN